MTLRRLLATSAVTAVVACGLIVGSATSANAALPRVWAPLTNTHVHVGVYTQPYDWPNDKLGIYDDTAPGDVQIDCWEPGGQVGTAGDVWYRTWQVYYPDGGLATDGDNNNPWWTFAPYVDYAYDFHNNVVPEC
jgi:hypothetical protein